MNEKSPETCSRGSDAVDVSHSRTDLEKGSHDRSDPEETPTNPEVKDIEHVYVRDDPRKWSRARKNATLVIVAAASMIATLGANIYSPAIKNIQTDLHASNSEIALSLSLFILVQGTAPLFWSAVSEIKGRKLVYLSSVTCYVVGCIIVATAKSIGVVIGMRCLQATGASAVLSIGAATLADIYEPHERGTMMGIYYAAPLLGPSMGPLLGGILTELFNWRATFWFLVIFGVVSMISFMLFKDTFRRDRSLAYQAALQRTREQLEREEKRKRGRDSAPESQTQTVVETMEAQTDEPKAKENDNAQPALVSTSLTQAVEKSEAQQATERVGVQNIKLSFKDINPITPWLLILQRRNNIVILCASGLFFGLGYSISYTCSRTFAMKYNYNALKIGLVLLSFGIGCMSGSILGGRWSDRVLRRLRAKNGGQSNPEMRLESTKPAMIFLPLSVLAYAWLCQKKAHVAAVCIALFFEGFFSIWMYTSTLAYIVDANIGRSSTAVASNSFFRGIAGFIAAEVGAPLQDSIGDGGLYSLWAGLMVMTELLLLLVLWKGGKWREMGIERELRKMQERESIDHL